MIKCAKCGKNYKFTRNSGLARWGCSNNLKIGKVECPSKLIPEEELERLTCEALGLEEFDEAVMRREVSGQRGGFIARPGIPYAERRPQKNGVASVHRE